MSQVSLKRFKKIFKIFCNPILGVLLLQGATIFPDDHPPLHRTPLHQVIRHNHTMLRHNQKLAYPRSGCKKNDYLYTEAS